MMWCRQLGIHLEKLPPNSTSVYNLSRKAVCARGRRGNQQARGQMRSGNDQRRVTDARGAASYCGGGG